MPQPAECEPIRLRALDGYELGASHYRSRGSGAPKRAAVLHCGAGIAAARYRHFAGFLAQAGMPVLTFDYRGIGQSRPPALRGFSATVEDWAEYDCAGAIAWLRERYPQTELVGIAHSIGSLLVGGARNAGEQSKLVLIGAHTGYYGDYRRRYRLPMALLWHGVMPALSAILGYFPGSRLGLGEDIPGPIALQWGGRLSPELRPREGGLRQARTRRLLDRCAALQRPTLVVSIGDDAFSTERSVKRLLSYYPGLDPELLVLTPADAGVSRIGHFGFFGRRAGTTLWPRLLARLASEPLS